MGESWTQFIQVIREESQKLEEVVPQEELNDEDSVCLA